MKDFIINGEFKVKMKTDDERRYCVCDSLPLTHIGQRIETCEVWDPQHF